MLLGLAQCGTACVGNKSDIQHGMTPWRNKEMHLHVAWQVETYIIGDRKISLRTSVLEEKATACSMICCYADELKEGFYPYVEQVSWPAVCFRRIQITGGPGGAWAAWACGAVFWLWDVSDHSQHSWHRHCSAQRHKVVQVA